jgi:hypothetical protein
VYNLALGDVDEDNEINDHIITDNGDRNKVLATVAAIVEVYTRRFPDRWVFFKGSTAERMRLYRMAVGINIEELSLLYEIRVYVNGELGAFKKDSGIEAFVIKRKKP